MFERVLYINLPFHIFTGKGLYPNEHLISGANVVKKSRGIAMKVRWMYRESYLSATKLDATWVIGFNVWRCKRSRAALQHEKCYPRHGTPSFFVVEIYSWLDRLVVMMYDVSQR